MTIQQNPETCKCEHPDHETTCLSPDCEWVALMPRGQRVIVMEMCQPCQQQHVECDTTVNVASALIHQAINDLDDSADSETLREIFIREGFGGRENGAVDEYTADLIVEERLAWLRDQHEEGLR